MERDFVAIKTKRKEEIGSGGGADSDLTSSSDKRRDARETADTSICVSVLPQQSANGATSC